MSFTSCTSCKSRLPPQDKHDLCLRCLAKTGHGDKACDICRAFTKKARQSRAKDLKYFRNKLKRGFDISRLVPPSKRKRRVKKPKTSSATCSCESNKKRNKTSKTVPLLLPPPPPPPALLGYNVSAAQDKPTSLQANSLENMIQDAPPEHREVLTSAIGKVDTDTSTKFKGVSPSTSTKSSATPGGNNTNYGLGSDDNLAQGHFRSSPKSPKTRKLEVSSSSPRGVGLKSGLQEHKVAANVKSMTKPYKRPLSDTEATPGRSSESNGKMKKFDSSSFQRVCQNIALVLPEALVPETDPSSSVFFPGHTSPSNTHLSTQFRILPNLVSALINPLLKRSPPRFFRDLANRYQMAEEKIFNLPLINKSLFKSICPSLSKQELRKTRSLPPFTVEASTLEEAYRSFEEQYRNACQQLRVAVHSEYFVRTQNSLMDKSKASGDPKLKELSKVHGFLTQDMICSCTSQLMSAVMGMRRLWLSVSRFQSEVQKSLLSLQFSMGSDLFPGAEAVLKNSINLTERRTSPHAQASTSHPTSPGPNPVEIAVPSQSREHTKGMGKYTVKTVGSRQSSCGN